MNVAVPRDGAYRVDPGPPPARVQLLDVPFGLETILAARGVLIEHSRAAAHELSCLFRTRSRTVTPRP